MTAPFPARPGADPFFTTLRRTEYARLDAAGHAYPGLTGRPVRAASRIDRHRKRLLGGVYGNPHSKNPTSRASTASLERARHRVLAFLDGPGRVRGRVHRKRERCATHRCGAFRSRAAAGSA